MILKTERLILRPFLETDAADVYEGYVAVSAAQKHFSVHFSTRRF